MILFNKAKLLELSKVRRTAHATRNVTTDDYNWLNTIIEKDLDTIITVIIEAAQLEVDIATPHVPPSMPFVTDYVEYRRYKTVDAKVVNVADHWNNQELSREIESYLWSHIHAPFNLCVGSSARFDDVRLKSVVFIK